MCTKVFSSRLFSYLNYVIYQYHGGVLRLLSDQCISYKRVFPRVVITYSFKSMLLVFEYSLVSLNSPLTKFRMVYHGPLISKTDIKLKVHV